MLYVLYLCTPLQANTLQERGMLYVLYLCTSSIGAANSKS